MKNQILALGNDAFNKGDYRLAIDLYEKSLVSYPELAKIIKGNITFAKRRFNNSSLSLVSSVDIIVPVFNALDDVKKCINSIVLNGDGLKTRVIIINDGSDELTAKWLNDFCQSNSAFQLIEHKQNLGYTKAVNAGLKESTADYVIALNSDTIVTSGWLVGMIRCMRSAPKIGIVGPLSNAATWQNVPNLRDESGSFAVNALPSGYSVEDMASVVRASSLRRYPKLPFVNGFCFMIKREVIEAIGFMDEENFPIGYGEENDYCIRASDAGFDLAIADDVYVYHAKSKSFGHDRRVALSKLGTESLKTKYSEEKYNDLLRSQKNIHCMDEIRAILNTVINSQAQVKIAPIFLKRILYILPVSGGGGGVHSIVQEVTSMQKMGIHANIAIPEKHYDKFIKNYSDIDIIEKIFIPYEEKNLIELSRNFDVAVATIFSSMKLVKNIIDHNYWIKSAYYIQDYEPYFFENHSPLWEEAFNSYTMIPNCILFAKTEWLCKRINAVHKKNVIKVAPSIDHNIFKPNFIAKKRDSVEDKLVVSAMIRPATPRRGAPRTMRLLKRLHQSLGNQIHIEIFGCSGDDPKYTGMDINFPHINHGPLTRIDVASVLQKTDFFIDLSDYQAFGRTALEAMACGAIPVITDQGGIYEYAKHLENSIIVNVSNEDECYKATVDVICEKKSVVSNLKINALLTASNYSLTKASLSVLMALNKSI